MYIKSTYSTERANIKDPWFEKKPNYGKSKALQQSPSLRAVVKSQVTAAWSWFITLGSKTKVRVKSDL